MGAGAALFAVSAGVQAVGKIAEGWETYEDSKLQAKQYQMQKEQMEYQKEVLSREYRDKRTALRGNAVAKAAASGLKISGSVAESISQSLAEIGIEESRQKYNISLKQNDLSTQAKLTKIQGRQALYGGFFNAGTSLLGSTAKYQSIWGTPNTTPTGG